MSLLMFALKVQRVINLQQAPAKSRGCRFYSSVCLLHRLRPPNAGRRFARYINWEGGEGGEGGEGCKTECQGSIPSDH